MRREGEKAAAWKPAYRPKVNRRCRDPSPKMTGRDSRTHGSSDSYSYWFERANGGAVDGRAFWTLRRAASPNGKHDYGEHSRVENDSRNGGHFDGGAAFCPCAIFGDSQATALIWIMPFWPLRKSRRRAGGCRS